MWLNPFSWFLGRDRAAPTNAVTEAARDESKRKRALKGASKRRQRRALVCPPASTKRNKAPRTSSHCIGAILDAARETPCDGGAVTAAQADRAAQDLDTLMSRRGAAPRVGASRLKAARKHLIVSSATTNRPCRQRAKVKSTNKAKRAAPMQGNANKRLIVAQPLANAKPLARGGKRVARRVVWLSGTSSARAAKRAQRNAQVTSIRGPVSIASVVAAPLAQAA